MGGPQSLKDSLIQSSPTRTTGLFSIGPKTMEGTKKGKLGDNEAEDKEIYLSTIIQKCGFLLLLLMMNF